MSRIGKPHRPFFRINLIDSRTKRDGSVIEPLGWYDPMAKSDNVKLNEERIKYWLSKGAQPSDTVRNFLADRNLVNVDKVKALHAKRIESKKKTAERAAAAASGAKKEEKKS
ncbi:MAG: 30S ribosomal protein S16 [Phycisphaerae bacterium]|nr:30S ribosomal protein S16 [Phycisphaerae bacterium]